MLKQPAVNKIDITLESLQNSQIPVFPSGLHILLEAFESEHINYQKLTKIISNFPSITARLIFLANSAWASPTIPIDSLEMACSRLGLSMVRSVSISLCIVSPFNSLTKCPAFNIEHFWAHALLTAEGTTMLLPYVADSSTLNRSTLHTSGLLHNLGILWLAGNWPEQTSLALETSHLDDSITTIEAFRNMTGTDYCQAGGILGRAWKLPKVLVSAMEQHNHSIYPTSNNLNTILVGYTVEMVSALFLHQPTRPPFPEQLTIEFVPADLDEVYIQLGKKLTETRALAHSMFSSTT